MSGSGETSPEDLASRVATLEKAVAALEERVAGLSQAATPAPTPAPLPIATPPPPPLDDLFATAPPALARPSTAPSDDPGQWAGRLGIALLLLGAAFGFKYSIDRGWIGPAMRVACGFGLGVVLVFASTRLRASRLGLSRILAGGGIGAAYLSAYAAYAFYGLVPHPVAFAAMTGITAFAWVLSVRESDAAVATLATAVGLATPFLLMWGSGSVVALVLYTMLVVAGAAGVFARRGWPVLLWTTSVGAWTVLALAASQAAGDAFARAAAVEAGVAFVAAATWGVGVARELRGDERDAGGPAVTGGRTVPSGPVAAGGRFLSHDARDGRGEVHQLALGTPVAAMFVTASAWTLGDTGSGLVSAALAAAWAGLASWMGTVRSDAAKALAGTHAAGAAVMLAFAISWLLGDDATRIGLSAEALALLVVAARTHAIWPQTIGHVLYAIVALQTAPRLLDGLAHSSVSFGIAEAADLAAIASLAAGSLFAPVHSAALLGVAAQAGLLAWLQGVLGARSGGDQLVTAAWFANAVALVVAGLRADSDGLRRTGAVVMALTMAKLFVHDLASADPFWRIVVFGGFGLVLLGLGYAFPTLWKRRDGA